MAKLDLKKIKDPEIKKLVTERIDESRRKKDYPDIQRIEWLLEHTKDNSSFEKTLENLNVIAYYENLKQITSDLSGHRIKRGYDLQIKNQQDILKVGIQHTHNFFEFIKTIVKNEKILKRCSDQMNETKKGLEKRLETVEIKANEQIINKDYIQKIIKSTVSEFLTQMYSKKREEYNKRYEKEKNGLLQKLDVLINEKDQTNFGEISQILNFEKYKHNMINSIKQMYKEGLAPDEISTIMKKMFSYNKRQPIDEQEMKTLTDFYNRKALIKIEETPAKGICDDIDYLLENEKIKLDTEQKLLYKYLTRNKTITRAQVWSFFLIAPDFLKKRVEENEKLIGELLRVYEKIRNIDSKYLPTKAKTIKKVFKHAEIEQKNNFREVYMRITPIIQVKKITENEKLNRYKTELNEEFNLLNETKKEVKYFLKNAFLEGEKTDLEKIMSLSAIKNKKELEEINEFKKEILKMNVSKKAKEKYNEIKDKILITSHFLVAGTKQYSQTKTLFGKKIKIVDEKNIDYYCNQIIPASKKLDDAAKNKINDFIANMNNYAGEIDAITNYNKFRDGEGDIPLESAIKKENVFIQNKAIEKIDDFFEWKNYQTSELYKKETQDKIIDADKNNKTIVYLLKKNELEDTFNDSDFEEIKKCFDYSQKKNKFYYSIKRNGGYALIDSRLIKLKKELGENKYNKFKQKLYVYIPEKTR